VDYSEAEECAPVDEMMGVGRKGEPTSLRLREGHTCDTQAPVGSHSPHPRVYPIAHKRSAGRQES